MGKNVLVIAPHADDEAFGMGGTIKKMRNKGWYVKLLVMTVGRELDSQETIDARMREMKEASKILGNISPFVFQFRCDANLNMTGMEFWIGLLEDQLKATEYDYVFYPYPSHHQDHQYTQRVCIAALRPGAIGYTPKGIYMYEYTYPGWKTMDVPQGRMYVDITDTINEKGLAVEAYESQLKGNHNHPISLNAMWTLAKMRGLAIGVEFAEMFYVVQEVMQI